MRRVCWFLLGILVVLGLSLLVAFLLPFRIQLSDFLILYNADKALLHGVPLYDLSGQVALIARLADVSTQHVKLLPYPYPPWYALSTLFLGALPYQNAALAWLILNLGMAGLSLWLLTDGWNGWLRLAAVGVGLFFVPMLGLLIVGQYSAPVLLGVALFLFAVRREDLPLTVAALLLMTFKPHIGLLLFVGCVVWLLGQAGTFGRRALRWALVSGIALFALGFLADSRWPLDYITSLLGYRALPGVSSCGLCASLSVALVRVAGGQSNTLTAGWVSLVLLLGLGFWLGRGFRSRLGDVHCWMAVVTLATLLVDPYLLNYDYILLLVPLLYLLQTARRRLARLVAGLVYLMPWGTLALGRDGNLFYPLLALLLGIFVVGQKRQAG